MTQNTKNLLMIGGVAVVGYLIYKQMSKPKNFANATGRSLTGKTRMGSMCSAGSDDPSCNLCGESCVNNRCNFATYNQNGQITGYRTISCGGVGESGGYGTTLLQGKK
jgi:hypothetical protein